MSVDNHAVEDAVFFIVNANNLAQERDEKGVGESEAVEARNMPSPSRISPPLVPTTNRHPKRHNPMRRVTASHPEAVAPQSTDVCLRNSNGEASLRGIVVVVVVVAVVVVSRVHVHVLCVRHQK